METLQPARQRRWRGHRAFAGSPPAGLQRTPLGARQQIPFDRAQDRREAARDRFIADYNGLFAINAEQEGSAFVVDGTGALREILCVQEDRTVGQDNAVKWDGLSLQLPASRLHPHFVKTTVRLHVYLDGQIPVFWGPHRLADYDAQGIIIQPERQAA